MGGECTVPARDSHQRQINKQIEKLLQNAFRQSHKMQVLVLGGPNSGKTTIIKHMKLMYQDEELIQNDAHLREYYKTLIFQTIISQLKSLCETAERIKMDYKKPENLEFAKNLLSAGATWSKETGVGFLNLLEEPAIKELYQKGDIHFKLSESCEYFLPQISRFIDPDYVPTTQDYLYVRDPTPTSVDQVDFSYSVMPLVLIDGSGVRGHRRKWLECFSDVSGIFFCVSLLSYCQPSDAEGYEGKTQLEESIDICREVLNHPRLLDATHFIFFTKSDLFPEYLLKNPLSSYLTGAPTPTEDNPDIVKTSQEFIRDNFIERIDGLNQGTFKVQFINTLDTPQMLNAMLPVKNLFTIYCGSCLL